MRLEDLKNRYILTHTEDYFVKVLLKDTKLKNIMAKPAISIIVDAHFSEVVELFNKHGIRHLPVVDKNETLVGLITQRDLYKVCPPRKLTDGWYYEKEDLDHIILRNVMKPQPFTMRIDDCLGDAILRMVEHKYGCIPVIDAEHRLMGIVTQYDILGIAATIYLE